MTDVNGEWAHFDTKQFFQNCLSPSEKGSALRRRNLLPLGVDSFLGKYMLSMGVNAFLLE